MKSFKFLFSSFLSTVLLVSSPGVLAQGQLIEEVPEIYYLEEMDDGQNVQVTACYRVLEGEEIFSDGLRNLGSNCDTVVEVSLADLESFTLQLWNEIDSINPTAIRWKAGLGGVGGGFFAIVSLVGVSIVEEGVLKKLPRNRKEITKDVVVTALSIGASIGLAVFAGKAIIKLNHRNNNKDLLQKLRRGTVNQQMERFTDFLNQHGRLVVSESAS